MIRCEHLFMSWWIVRLLFSFGSGFNILSFALSMLQNTSQSLFPSCFPPCLPPSFSPSLLSPLGSVYFFIYCIVDIQYYSSFRLYNKWFGNFIHYSAFTMISAVIICHPRTLLQYYWLYSLCCTFHFHGLFIL